MEPQADKEARWKRENESAKRGAATGNPYATLCLHCYGRHWSPKDYECPHPKFEKSA